MLSIDVIILKSVVCSRETERKRERESVVVLQEVPCVLGSQVGQVDLEDPANNHFKEIKNEKNSFFFLFKGQKRDVKTVFTQALVSVLSRR